MTRVARSKRTKKPAAKAAPTPERHPMDALLATLESRVFDAVKGFGCLLHGVPTTGIPRITDTLAQMAVELHLVRAHLAREVTS